MKSFLIDGHCDTITMVMEKNKELIKNDCHIDIERLREFESPVQFFAVWLQPKYYSNALEQTLKYIDFYKSQLEKYSDYIGKAETVEDIYKNRKEQKISAVLAVEGGEAIEGNIASLKLLYELGVRAMTLTWNYDNQIAGGSSGDNGMTEFGYKVIETMYSLGMIVDVSHLSEKSFWDFNRVATGPYMASHSNVKSLCNHKRNLSDKQIKAIADKNGIIGINLYKEFLSNENKVTLDDIMKHIDYILRLVGSDYIGFGCDFDGVDETPESISDVSKLNIVCERIINTYGDTVAEKILNKNFMRLMGEAWK